MKHLLLDRSSEFDQTIQHIHKAGVDCPGCSLIHGNCNATISRLTDERDALLKRLAEFERLTATLSADLDSLRDDLTRTLN